MVYREHELDLTVTRREVVAADVVTLTLAGADGEPLPAWTPGAHIDLVLGPSLVRQYSLCGTEPKDEATWRIGVLRDPNSRGGSQAVHDTLHEGAVVRARGPRNHFTLVDAPRYIFIGGGIGITPVRALFETVPAAPGDLTLLYRASRPEDVVFRDELEHIAAVRGARVQYLLGQGVRFTPRLLLELVPDLRGRDVYLCASPVMSDAVRASLVQAGLPEEQLHEERFAF
jgi:ferredoxin-NADP reductase